MAQKKSSFLKPRLIYLRKKVGSKISLAQFVIAVVLMLLILFPATKTFALSSYILPYPPIMPGSKLYPFRILLEEIEKLWYFGDFAKIRYYQNCTDKYLVEAKVLFEYQQYLLATRALAKSDACYQKMREAIMTAKEHGKNISEKQTTLSFLAVKHKEVLVFLRNNLPKTFLWTPEKQAPTLLKLHEIIDRAIRLRVAP